jgi:hypothetical protein
VYVRLSRVLRGRDFGGGAREETTETDIGMSVSESESASTHAVVDTLGVADGASSDPEGREERRAARRERYEVSAGPESLE